MKLKLIVKVALLVFVAGSVTFLVAKEFNQSGGQSCCGSASAPATDAPASRPNDLTTSVASTLPAATTRPTKQVIAYYFHGDARCVSCMRIEAWTRSAIDKFFIDAEKQGRLEWRVVNVERPDGRHFIGDYELATKSVVLVQTENGKRTGWKQLPDVWKHLQNQNAFHEYVRGELAAYLRDE